VNRPTTWSAAPDGEDHDGPYLVPTIPGGVEMHIDEKLEEDEDKQENGDKVVESIKSLDERKDVMGKNTFSLPEWWRCNSGAIPHFAYVLRALLTNAPNSCPPERVFSMFNATWRGSE